MDIFLKVLLSVLLLVEAKAYRVDPNNSLFLDQYNRYTIFHGVNAVYKTYPFHPNLV